MLPHSAISDFCNLKMQKKKFKKNILNSCCEGNETKIKETFFLVGMKANWDKNCSRILPGDNTMSAGQLRGGPSGSSMLEFAV